MAKSEKTVFISYRRTDVYTALAVYQDLTSRGYDVFFDYTSIHSGDFEQIIVGNIKARAHFVLILTPTALDRCSQPGDWLRREIETAMDEKRNIVPLFFNDFDFGVPAVKEKLTGKLANLNRYNGMNVYEDYFKDAMDRLSEQFLNVPLDTVIHPLSTEVQKVVKKEQHAAEKALVDEKTKVEKASGAKKIMGVPRNLMLVGGGIGIVLILALGIAGVMSLMNNGPQAAPVTSPPSENVTMSPDERDTDVDAPVGPATEPELGSTMTSPKDGMSMVYVPAGKFEMGSDSGYEDEKPVHTVDLDAYWIDKTEVTNLMYANFLNQVSSQAVVFSDEAVQMDGRTLYDLICSDCEWDDRITWDGERFSAVSALENHPVVLVSWYGAQAYCTWADRRLPTEAEWEKAARGENGSTYPWGNDAPSANLLNYNLSVETATSAAGSYPGGASPYGALDMAGNVSEWVADWYGDTYYGDSPASNPTGPESGSERVLRGGSWGDETGDYLRSSYRWYYDPSQRLNVLGFRCAMDAE
jgi:formylglycine-generating enzyme required for sulfatase activity